MSSGVQHGQEENSNAAEVTDEAMSNRMKTCGATDTDNTLFEGDSNQNLTRRLKGGKEYSPYGGSNIVTKSPNGESSVPDGEADNTTPDDINDLQDEECASGTLEVNKVPSSFTQTNKSPKDTVEVKSDSSQQIENMHVDAANVNAGVTPNQMENFTEEDIGLLTIAKSDDYMKFLEEANRNISSSTLRD